MGFLATGLLIDQLCFLLWHIDDREAVGPRAA